MQLIISFSDSEGYLKCGCDLFGCCDSGVCSLPFTVTTVMVYALSIILFFSLIFKQIFLLSWLFSSGDCPDLLLICHSQWLIYLNFKSCSTTVDIPVYFDQAYLFNWAWKVVICCNERYHLHEEIFIKKLTWMEKRVWSLIWC